MSKIIYRLREPSTWAGMGLICQSLAALLASKGADPQAWAGALAGAAAVLMKEGAR